MVHDPQITPFIRVNIVMGEFLYIGIGKPREAAKYEYVPDDGCLVIGDIDPHHGLQFRFEKETSVAVGYVDVESGKRIGGDPAVLESGVGHQLQLLDRSMNAAGKHMTNSREINHILLNKFTLQLPERDILQLVFVLQECGQITAGTGVVHEGSLCTVFADALLGELFQVVVEGLQQELISVSESQPGIPDLLGRDVRIPVADTLVLLADVGLDVLQFLVDPLGYDALTRCFVGFGVPQFGRDRHFATELRDGSVDGDASHDGCFAVLFGLSFQIEQNLESASCHNSKNFIVNTFVRVICCCEIRRKKLKNNPLKTKSGKSCGNDLVTQLFPNFAFSCG